MAIGQNLDRDRCLEETIPEAPFPPEEALLTEIPDWLVNQICYSSGKRGPKYVREYPDDPLYSYPSHGFYNPNRHVPRTNSLEPKKGNLTQNEYRFWRGLESPKGVASWCKWCGEYCLSKEERIRHLEEAGNICTSALRAIFDYMRKVTPMYCFVCGEKTNHTRWGFPLCSKVSCIEGWQFKTNRELSLMKEAVRICVMRGLLAKYINTAEPYLRAYNL